MNDTPYSEVREVIEPSTASLLVRDGWMILQIYLRKREVRHSDPREFEEYPVYIMGNTVGG